MVFGQKENRLAEVVERHTRTVEGRVLKGMRVRLPPSAPYIHGGVGQLGRVNGLKIRKVWVRIPPPLPILKG